MSKAVECHVFSGYSVGHQSVSVSHLQYANDTLIIGGASSLNVWAIKSILQIFELVAGLKVNFHKSKLFGFNINIEVLNLMAQFLNCKVGSLPFCYLGLPLGENPHCIKTWEPVISKLKKRLSKWKSSTLSFGGRSALLKSVLNSIPTYYLSFFKAPQGIISKLESLFKLFLWGGDENHRKIAWVAWQEVCKGKEHGGLGILDLRAFNLAILEKWRWHLLVEKGRFWHKVVTSIYGEGCFQGVGDKVQSSKWWVDLWTIDFAPYASFDWFSSRCTKVVGDGQNTFFWKDGWSGQGPLCNRYSRLFSIASDKDVSVANMVLWRDGGFEWIWSWRRSLFQWELDLLSQLAADLGSTVLKNDCCDRWCWKDSNDEIYNVKSAYKAVINDGIYANFLLHKFLWSSCVPSKVSGFAWKALLNRIPSNCNLIKRKVLDISASGCAWYGEDLENTSHLLFGCYYAYSVWLSIFDWFGVSTVLHNSCHENFAHFIGIPRCSGRDKMRWSVVWLATIWSLWLARNNVIFKDKVVAITDLVELIKIRSWNWIKTKDKSFFYSFST
uniref:Ribonuclease H protein At1g65750 family n=1 Tax=Cajanus cajan TaxID=3821 RepID=A0A151T3U8_CAJCA|nr:Putative ribonuclease H protein At1g65750 family [Cajanus cajan]